MSIKSTNVDISHVTSLTVPPIMLGSAKVRVTSQVTIRWPVRDKLCSLCRNGTALLAMHSGKMTMSMYFWRYSASFIHLFII